jgi:hypothetical protein
MRDKCDDAVPRRTTLALDGMIRPLWQIEGKQRFPDLGDVIDEAETPYEMWTRLWNEFVAAYDSGDATRVAAIYAFAEWCGTQLRGTTAAHDLPTCVNVCFVEHIPTHQAALEDMPQWFTLEQVQRLEPTLSYHVGPDGFKRILAS